MAVNKLDRRESKVEFDATYYKVFMDAELLVEHHFGVKGDRLQEKAIFIKTMSERVLKIASDIGTHIRIANSIYPQCLQEARERRVHQDKAIGLCFDLLTKYQNIMVILKISNDKYLTEISNLIHEINCIKKWRESDNKRFHAVG